MVWYGTRYRIIHNLEQEEEVDTFLYLNSKIQKDSLTYVRAVRTVLYCSKNSNIIQLPYKIVSYNWIFPDKSFEVKKQNTTILQDTASQALEYKTKSLLIPSIPAQFTQDIDFSFDFLLRCLIPKILLSIHLCS